MGADASEIVAKPFVPVDDLKTTPGHLIRRLQQIAVAMFIEDFDGAGVTNVQFAALVEIARNPGLDQSALVNAIAIDRSTIGAILKWLEERDYIKRITPRDNLRVKQLYIRPKGDALLRSTPDMIRRSMDRLLAPLSASDRETFVRLLKHLVEANNEFSRAPVRVAAARKIRS